MFKEQPAGKGGWTTLNGGGRVGKWWEMRSEKWEVMQVLELPSVRTLDFTLDDGKHRYFEWEN